MVKKRKKNSNYQNLEIKFINNHKMYYNDFYFRIFLISFSWQKNITNI